MIVSVFVLESRPQLVEGTTVGGGPTLFYEDLPYFAYPPFFQILSNLPPPPPPTPPSLSPPTHTLTAHSVVLFG